MEAGWWPAGGHLSGPLAASKKSDGVTGQDHDLSLQMQAHPYPGAGQPVLIQAWL